MGNKVQKDRYKSKKPFLTPFPLTFSPHPCILGPAFLTQASEMDR